MKELYKVKGPILLLAGPGTGKTFNLAKRIKYLIEEKAVPPEKITVITFTSSAARNMRERISDPTREELFIDHHLQPKLICTMHSLGHKILTEMHSQIGLGKDINVLFSDKLREIIIGDAAQLVGLKRKDGGKTIDCRQKGECNPSDEEKCTICKTYQKILRSVSTIDHDDQIFLACKILQENEELRKKYLVCCENLLVDEYQDLNASQFKLVKLLSASQREGLFVVGDDDQSIYSWRGGSPEYIRSFKDTFGENARIETLKKSYRCSYHILEGALSMVSKFDSKRLHKECFEYKKEEGSKIKIHSVPSDKKEAKEVRKIIEKSDLARNILILIPNKYFLPAITTELKRAKIKYVAPSKLPGEGLPLLATLSKWLNNTDDSLSFRECIHSFVENPLSGVPSSRVRKEERIEQREEILRNISLCWNKVLSGENNNLWDSMKLNSNNGEFCSVFVSVFTEIIDLYESEKDLKEFVAKVIEILRPWNKAQNFLNEIASWIEVLGDSGVYGQVPRVEIVSFQSAKGLEADIVCVIGLEEGVLPRSKSTDLEVAEQSRLMFVAMTRAIEELHLFHARNRTGKVMLRKIHKDGEPPDIAPSQFLSFIPEENKEEKFHRA